MFGDELRLKQGTIAIENERMNAIMAANNKLAAMGKNISAELLIDFIEAIPEKFRLIEISLNRSNNFSVPFQNWSLKNNFM